MEKINVAQKFTKIHNYWDPRILAELNGQAVKIAKVKGVFDWHHHEEEDELFWIHKGELKMEFRDKVIILKEGEMLVVPKGIEHRPVAEEEVELILFEPLTTLNTGNVISEKTKLNPNKI